MNRLRRQHGKYSDFLLTTFQATTEHQTTDGWLK